MYLKLGSQNGREDLDTDLEVSGLQGLFFLMEG